MLVSAAPVAQGGCARSAPVAIRQDSASTMDDSIDGKDDHCSVDTDNTVKQEHSALEELAALNARYADDAAALIRRCKTEAETVAQERAKLDARLADKGDLPGESPLHATIAMELRELAQARLGVEIPCGDLAGAVDAFINAWKNNSEPEDVYIRQRDEARLQLQQERTRFDQAASAHAIEIATLETALAEAREMKTKDEQDVEEFKQVRLKTAEIQDLKLQIAEIQQCVERERNTCVAAEALVAQKEAEMVANVAAVEKMKSELDEQVAELKFLAEENQQLRLEFENDAMDGYERPWSQETRCEVDALRKDIESVMSRFPMLSDGSIVPWAHVARDALVKRHATDAVRFQLQRKVFRDVSKREDSWPSNANPTSGIIDGNDDEDYGKLKEYLQEESELRDGFEAEKEKLIKERDDKVAQLVATAEKKVAGAAQKQLLLKQAQLFSQRLDAKVDRLGEEHLKRKRVLHEEFLEAKSAGRSSSKQKCEDGNSSMVELDRFEEAVRTRLQSLEEEYHRMIDRETQVSSSVLKYATPYDFTCHLDVAKEPVSVCWVEDACGKILRHRIDLRAKFKAEMESSTFAQLQTTHEDFRVKECKAMRPQSKGVFVGARLVSLLHNRHHRVCRDLCKRQFFDFLLLLRFCQVAAQDLLLDDSIPELPAPGDDIDDRGRLMLTLIHIARRTSDELHKEEFLSFICNGTRDVRNVVQCLCQNEPDIVDEVVSEELNILSLNLRVCLLSERTDEIREMRQAQEEEVEEEVDQRLGMFARGILADERATLESRKQFLEAKCAEADGNLLRSYEDELEVVSSKLETIRADSDGITKPADDGILTIDPASPLSSPSSSAPSSPFYSPLSNPLYSSWAELQTMAADTTPTALTVIMRQQAQKQRELMHAQRSIPMPPPKPSGAPGPRRRPTREGDPILEAKLQVPCAEQLCEWPFDGADEPVALVGAQQLPDTEERHNGSMHSESQSQWVYEDDGDSSEGSETFGDDHLF